MKLSDKYIKLYNLLKDDYNVLNNNLIDQSTKNKYNTIVLRSIPIETSNMIDGGSATENIFNIFVYGKTDFEALLNAEKAKGIIEDDYIALYSGIEPVKLSSEIPAYVFRIKI